MALIDAEGFGWSSNASDYMTYGYWKGSQFYNHHTGGPDGASYVSTFDAGVAPNRQYPTALTAKAFMGIRMNLSGTAHGSQSGTIVSWNDENNNNQISVNANYATGVWQILVNGTVVAQSGSGCVPPGWFYLEIGGTIASGTGGDLTLRVNGATLLSVSGINTQGAGTNTISYVYFGEGGYSNFELYFTDYYLCDGAGTFDNSFLGDVRVQDLLPTGPGSNTQFTPVGQAANWQNASTIPPAPSTDYNESTTVGAVDTFAISGLDPTFSTIYGLLVKGIFYKDPSGSRSMATVCQSGTVDSVGASVAMGSSAQQIVSVFTDDPNTGTAWTAGGVQAMQPGYKITS